jgi:predicted kinase
MPDSSSSSLRSVKIGSDERTGWSSERPRREGEPERPRRPVDVSARCRVLSPTDRLRYAPGSLLLVVGADTPANEAFAARVIEEPNALLSLAKIRTLLQGRVAAEELEDKAEALLDATAAKRLAAGDSVVIPVEGLDPSTRERYVRMAHGHRRPRHLILIETGKDRVAEEDRDTLRDLRSALDAGGLGAEGFFTALRLGGSTIGELKKVVFAPPPSDT